MSDLTGEGPEHEIIGSLKDIKLDTKVLVGQGYDGTSAMSSCVNGIKKHALLATYVHCASHVQNLVLNNANSVSEIINMFDTVKEITNLINESGKRREIMRLFR